MERPCSVQGRPVRCFARAERGAIVTVEQLAGEKQWSQIVALAWADPGFKSRLLADPGAVLQEHGLELEPGMQVKVIENTDKVRHLILPESPSGELSEEELSPAVGADSWCGHCRRCGRCGRCGCGCDCRGCDRF